jgi:hypothetical protein
MNKIGVCALSAAFGACLAASASAQAGKVCRTGDACIVDANNQQVGRIIDNGSVLRNIAGELFIVDGVQRRGVQPHALFYYNSNDCTGTPYMQGDYGGAVPRLASYDGFTFYAADTNTISFTWGSYSYPAAPAKGGSCFPYGQNCVVNGQPAFCGGTGGVAATLQSATFVAPLTPKLVQ